MLEAACMAYCMHITVVRMLEGGSGCCSAGLAYGMLVQKMVQNWRSLEALSV
jgi:hypothetical protein